MKGDIAASRSGEGGTALHTATSRAHQQASGENTLRDYLEAAPEHGSTTDAVTDALREAILDGALPPSRWLREDDLAKELSVSRTPVREALRRLSDERVILRTAHRGSLVAPMTFDEVLAVYLVREVLEGLAAQIAARRCPAGLIEALTRVHRELNENSGHAATGELVRLNLEFHRLLREATGNPYLERFLTQVEHAVRRFGRSTYEIPGRAEEMLAEHRAILEAIAAGDADAAYHSATEHMRRARDARVRGMLDQ